MKGREKIYLVVFNRISDAVSFPLPSPLNLPTTFSSSSLCPLPQFFFFFPPPPPPLSSNLLRMQNPPLCRPYQSRPLWTRGLDEEKVNSWFRQFEHLSLLMRVAWLLSKWCPFQCKPPTPTLTRTLSPPPPCSPALQNMPVLFYLHCRRRFFYSVFANSIDESISFLIHIVLIANRLSISSP